MRLQLERYHADPSVRLVNCMGPLSDAVAKWCSRSRTRFGRLVFSTGGPIGAAVVHSYRHAPNSAGRIRGLSAVETPHVLGAAIDAHSMTLRSKPPLKRSRNWLTRMFGAA